VRCRIEIRGSGSVCTFNHGVIPGGAAFQAKGGISLKTVPGEIPLAAELRRASG
jgi:hypothetical protein